VTPAILPTGRRDRQRGYTLVDLLVTLAVGGIVLGAAFPLFLLLYRSETSFSRAAQARAGGLLAEESLLRDIRTFQVTGTGNNTLVLTGLAASGGSTYSVQYSVASGENALIRTVTDQSGTEIQRRIVAHDIQGFATSCSGTPAVVQVSLTVMDSQGLAIPVQPDLSFSPRNGQGCP
jgi:prepilin-type N-terminal cleavage/methylation domain-containing protein